MEENTIKSGRRKIAVVIPKYGLTGGAERFTAMVTEKIASLSPYEFHVFAREWEVLSERVIFHRVPLISFPRFLTSPSFAWFAGRMIAPLNFDLVHAYDRMFTADIFTMHGIPHRLWRQDIRKKRLGLHDRAMIQVEQSIVNSPRCRRFFAVSELAKDKFLQVYGGDPERVEVLHPGVDTKRWQGLDRSSCRRTLRERYGIDREDKIILFVSMNFAIKGLDFLMAALAALKSQKPLERWTLLVVGKGEIPAYAALAAKSGIGERVLFSGILKKEELDQAYLGSDVFSILSRFDTFGLVVLEAMAASLPVIVSSQVGAKDLVREGENGFVIEDPRDALLIAQRIGLLMDDADRSRMGLEALQTARAHTWEAVAGRVMQTYEALLAPGARS